MKFLKAYTLLSLLAVGATNITAQEVLGGPINVPRPDLGVVDGVYIKEHIPTKRLIPYEYVREADVIWSKRVYQRIDLREKINHNLYFPMDKFGPSPDYTWIREQSRWSLWTVIRSAIVRDEITVFDNENPDALGNFDGDQFKYPILSTIGGNYSSDTAYQKNVNRLLGDLAPAKQDAQGNLLAITSILDPESDSLDANGQVVYPPRDMNWLTSRDIVSYYLKEDWFFDKERSVLDVRILGIAPVVHWSQKDRPVITDETGTKSGEIRVERPLFWLYFPQLRFILNNYFVYNDQNDAQWMSFDDLFWKRRFNSTIIKESNTYDRSIETYRMGVDALLESDKIKEEIRTIEHDVWNF